MLESLIVYSSLVTGASGLVLALWPVRRFGVTRRSQGLVIAVVGGLLAVVGLALPPTESHVRSPETRLDAFVPRWQFRERHALRVQATPERVYEAMTQVRSDEILLFRVLTWLRRGGRPMPGTILDAGDRPLIDVALESGFVSLTDDPPRELVMGTVILAPRGTQGELTPEVFHASLPPGFALAAMNFLVTPDGEHGSLISTETRVFANSPGARTQFAPYWRLIYPGSAIIRRMWLRAIRERALDTGGRP